MQVNAYASIASKTLSQVGNKKSDASTKETNINSANANIDQKVLKELNSLGGKGITELYFAQFQSKSYETTLSNANSQVALNDLANAKGLLSSIDLSKLGYSGKNPLEMNSSELDDLLGENGFFGVTNTANRIADFVISGAGDDVSKLKKGLEGIKKGFEMAQNMWGSKLPQISQDTMNASIEKVSSKINELGEKALDLKA